MQLTNSPPQLVLPFANSGSKNTIPVPSQIPITPGAASYTDGFPPLTFLDPVYGGVPPSGNDFNGILYSISDPVVWACAGGAYVYNSTFSAAIGGYPKGARILQANGIGYWRSAVDNNTTDPDTGGAGWIPDGAGGAVASVYASAQQTLATGSAKVLFDTVEFDSTGLWNSTNKRFVALWDGPYRITASVALASPGGQLFAAQIMKNGVLAKQCLEIPQESDGNMSISYNAIISLAIGDYLEVYLQIPETNVLAGTAGSNEAYVYAQIEYLG